MRHLLLPLAASLLAAAASADVVTVQVGTNFFSPKDVTIQAGDTVRWVHVSGVHDVTEGTDGTVDGDEAFYAIVYQGTYEVVFDGALLSAHPRPGNRYDYFCSPHFFLGMTGSVTVIDAGGPGTSFCACDAGGAPCGNAGGAGEGCANSTGAGATLAAGGSASAAADDLSFTAGGLLPGQPALLFAGANAVNGGAGAAFGDGLRCAGGGVARLGVRIPDAGGGATWSGGLVALGGFAAGDVRRFQAWYRDPQGSPCGNGFNLSNGVEVTFAP